MTHLRVNTGTLRTATNGSASNNMPIGSWQSRSATTAATWLRASRDKSARVFNAKTGDMESSYLGHGDAVFSVAFSADDKLVFTAGRDRKIHVWEASDAKKAGEIAGFDNEIYKLIVTGSDVFSCSADKLVRQHRATGNHELVRTFAGHADFVYTLAYYQAEQRLAAGSFDGNVRVWSAPDGQLITSFRAAPGLVSGTP